MNKEMARGTSPISAAAVGSQGGAASRCGLPRASDNGKVVIKLNMAASSSGEKALRQVLVTNGNQ